MESETVRALLETIERRLARLEALAPVTAETYADDPDVQDIVDRNLEVLLQACIDMGLHVLADRPNRVPERYRDVFAALAAEELIETELATRLEGAAGFRNLLVHGYAELIPEKVIDTLEELGDIRAYVAQLGRFFREQGILPKEGR
ncbi:MAG: type VII toxin-antitoxin system HepT family RNase toxin [Gemmatimonadota bacterium]